MSIQNIYRKFADTWLMLKVSYGLLFIVAGSDKFIDIIVHWQKYYNPILLKFFSLQHLNLAIALIEIIIGIVVLSPKGTRLGAYAVATWFFIIILNLVTMGFYFDIAARDAILAIGAIALAWLTEIKQELEYHANR